ncbi:AraC family transcriptional regulator [bacterium]|nr:AraC family transcriptional regulator [bacterium]
MFWVVFFSIGIAQGLFLITVILYKSSRNHLASRLISIIVFLMVLSHLGYLVIRTDLVRFIPQVYGIAWGTLLLFGPLLYFYSKSILDEYFEWKIKHWLHFIPYAMQLAFIIPNYFDKKEMWVQFIDLFLSGNAPISLYTKVTFGVQSAHLLIYLFITFRWIQAAKSTYQSIRYLVPVLSRINWLRALTYCMGAISITVFLLYGYILIAGKFNPVTNYFYTLITSGVIYFMAYSFVFNPEIISPDFVQKYRTYMLFDGSDGEKYLQKIRVLMEMEKIYTNPELKLSSLANELNLPQHQVSKLINDKYGKSFTDLINEYRVNEFIERISLPKYRSHSVYGIALDAGFNSKSSFNSAFKKITGKTPSEFKKQA